MSFVMGVMLFAIGLIQGVTDENLAASREDVFICAGAILISQYKEKP